MTKHECQYCGESFSSTYFKNVHEAEDCGESDGYDETETHSQTHNYGSQTSTSKRNHNRY